MKSIDIEDLPKLAIPIVDLIDEKQPDIIVGCDRGARLFSLAVKAMWRELHGSPLPTVDHTLRFMRVSSNYIGRKMLEHDLAAIVESSTKEKFGNQALQLLFIDDWVHTGAAYDAIQDTVAKLSPDSTTLLGTMTGTVGDAVGERTQYNHTDTAIVFKDSPEQLGIDYTWKGHAQIPKAVRSTTALDNRKRLYASARDLGTSSHR